ncbi:hypothetical protein TRVA0_021S02080 [Trichomonascus vanleenenianus]|uniref:uncharacterized protein n=1 Tax=Trichomonascus vanleenenianus TaxID=2268995 RepID=UPI003ECB153A
MGIFTSKRQSIIDAKRREREDRIKELPQYNEPLTEQDKSILNQLASDVVAQVQQGALEPSAVLSAYSKQAFNAQKDSNVVTEIMIKDAEKWADNCNKQGPLAGFPISFKDTVCVTGYDSCIGYSKKCFKPAVQDAPIIRLLKDAGAVPFVKTNVPYTLLSFESYNDVWGVSENPHVHGYTPGGSTGGEAGLLAFGGSRLGVGTDVAGSVRVPAHFAGIYSLKCSTGRFPKAGNVTSMPGQEGIPAVYSPMTRTLPDLSFFLKAILDMNPWEYDYSVHPMPWREVELPHKCKVGVMWTDGIVKPSPACERALRMTVDALRAQGHEIVDFTPPSPLKCLRVASQLLMSDGADIALRDQVCGEKNDAGVARAVFAQHLPRFVKKIWAWWVRYIKRDEIWATLIENWNVKKIQERWDLVYEREGYKADFFQHWKDSEIDFLLTVPNATPALPHKGLYETFSSCGYTFMFNLLDYSAGVFPVTKVNRSTDKLPTGFKATNGVEKGAYGVYDADKMHGLPVGVQVVTQRLEEEKALKAMELCESALHAKGHVYKLLNEY